MVHLWNLKVWGFYQIISYRWYTENWFFWDKNHCIRGLQSWNLSNKCIFLCFYKNQRFPLWLKWQWQRWLKGFMFWFCRECSLCHHSLKDPPFYKSDSRLFTLNLRGQPFGVSNSYICLTWHHSERSQKARHFLIGKEKLSCLSTRNNDSKYGQV